MSNKDDKPSTPLAAGVRSRIAKAFIDAYATSSTAGGVAGTTLCKTINGLSIPKSGISDADMDAIVGEVARPRGWERRTYAARKSEMRAVLNAIPKELKSAIDLYIDKTKACGWMNVVRLARILNNGECKTVKAVVTKALEPSEAKTIDTTAKAVAHIEKSLSRLVETPYLSKVLKAALLKFAVDHELDIGTTA